MYKSTSCFYSPCAFSVSESIRDNLEDIFDTDSNDMDDRRDDKYDGGDDDDNDDDDDDDDDDGVVETIEDNFDDILDNIKSRFGDDITDGFAKPLEKSVSSVSDILDSTSDVLDDTGDALKDSVDSALDNVYQLSLSGLSSSRPLVGSIVTDSAPTFDTRAAPDLGIPQFTFGPSMFSSDLSFSFAQQKSNSNDDDDEYRR